MEPFDDLLPQGFGVLFCSDYLHSFILTCSCCHRAKSIEQQDVGGLSVGMEGGEAPGAALARERTPSASNGDADVNPVAKTAPPGSRSSPVASVHGQARNEMYAASTTGNSNRTSPAREPGALPATRTGYESTNSREAVGVLGVGSSRQQQSWEKPGGQRDSSQPSSRTVPFENHAVHSDGTADGTVESGGNRGLGSEPPERTMVVSEPGATPDFLSAQGGSDGGWDKREEREASAAAPNGAAVDNDHAGADGVSELPDRKPSLPRLIRQSNRTDYRLKGIVVSV